MSRGSILCLDQVLILSGDWSCKCTVEAVVVVKMLEAVDDGVEMMDSIGQLVELVAQAPLQRSTAPLSLGVTPSLRFVRGLRSEQARHRPGNSDNMTGQTKKPAWGVLHVFGLQLPKLQGTPSLMQSSLFWLILDTAPRKGLADALAFAIYRPAVCSAP